MSYTRRFLRSVLVVLLIGVTVFTLLQIVKFASGTSSPFCVVISKSMSPSLNVGDLVIVGGVNSSDLKVGDIIVFHKPTNPNELVVHRIVDILRNGSLLFRTKGDANFCTDPWLVPEQLIEGKVIFVVPYVGWLNLIIRPPLSYILISIFMIMFIVTELMDLGREEESRNSNTSYS